MSKPVITQSQKRFQESVGALFSQGGPLSQKTCLFLKSSTDTGVIRNGGRNGARYAPQSFLSIFKKFALNHSLKELAFFDLEVSDQSEEEKDFHLSQEKETERISSALATYPATRFCHLGGGHDHVYPLLKALAKSYAKITVINVDAHADTRTDHEHHSGTPFRQFAREFGGKFELFQIGLNPFANSPSTLSPLEKGQSQTLWRNQIENDALDTFFAQIQNGIDEQTFVLFSLDADALNGAEMPGVSAVNPSGLSRSELLQIWRKYLNLQKSHLPALGIYELNPLYDTLSGASMRSMASFVYEGLFE